MEIIIVRVLKEIQHTHQIIEEIYLKVNFKIYV